jgi:hypothetical protein
MGKQYDSKSKSAMEEKGENFSFSFSWHPS